MLAAVAKIYDMPKVTFTPTNKLLANNLLLVSETLYPGERPDNSHKLAAALKMPQRTIYNVLIAKTDPYDKLDLLASKLNLHPWQLLYPVNDKTMLRLLQAYNEADAEGRQVFELAIKGVELRNAEQKAEEKAHKDDKAAS